MKLTEKEQEICNEYSKPDPTTRLVRCKECPLSLHKQDPWLWDCLDCYANIDGRSREAKELKRY